MGEHYAIALDHGLLRARDGLPWRHDPVPRLRLAEASGLEVTWDLAHFDRPPDPVAHAVTVARAADPKRPLRLCPVNEPSIYPMLAGMPWEEAVDMAIAMARAARDHHVDVRLLACDPINGIGERQFAAIDRLVSAGVVDIIGINSYPHTARAPLGRAILKGWRRYKLPILIAETSWHDGHRAQCRRFPGFDKWRWLEHVLAEVEWAQERGARVLKACKHFTEDGFKTNVTLCFSANQALMAAKAGATYVSPFIGRLDDTNIDGMAVIHDIRRIFDNYDFETQILAASIRTPNHVREAALIGADAATMPTSTLRALIKHLLTDKGLEGFIADWAKTGQTIV